MKRQNWFYLIIAVVMFVVSSVIAQDNDNKDKQKDYESTQQTTTDDTRQSEQSSGIISGLQSSTTMSMSNSTTTPVTVPDMSLLNEKPDASTKGQFTALADKQANDLKSKLGLDESQTKEIREELISYLEDSWKARVMLDKESDDADEVEDNNSELNELRVDISSEIKDELNDNQIAQWNAYKVEWWTNFDRDTFDLQHTAYEVARGNSNNNTDQQQ